MHLRGQGDVPMVGELGMALPLSSHNLIAVHQTKVCMCRATKNPFTRELRQRKFFVIGTIAMNGYGTHSVAASLSHITFANVTVNDSTCYCASDLLHQIFVVYAALL